MTEKTIRKLDMQNKFMSNYGRLSLVVVIATALNFSEAMAESEIIQNNEMKSNELSLRYQLERDGENYIRLDRKTGQMSVCSMRSEKLVCRLAADERDAFINELSHQQDKIDAYEEDQLLTDAQPKTDETESSESTENNN